MNDPQNAFAPLAERTRDTIDMLEQIEKRQRGRRIKSKLLRLWNKFTFRGYKNDRKKPNKESFSFKGL